MICSLPRSGSSLLCELLASTLHAGMPAEYFHPEKIDVLSRRWGVEGFDDYLRELVARKTSPNGVFGMKVHWGQYAEWLSDRDPARLLPNLRFVLVRREDRLRQAVSWVKAFQTLRWTSLVRPDGRPAAVFSHDEIARKISRIEREEAAWEEMIERDSITPHRITYEELAESPERVARGVLELLGVELPGDYRFERPTLERQADEETDRWVARYLADGADGRPTALTSRSRPSGSLGSPSP